VLASLLPGFREVRSALVAGYMWFCAAWLLWPPAGPQLLERPAIELLDLFGTGGRLVAISVLCLLVGEVTSALVHGLFFQLSARYLRRLTPANFGDRLSGLLSPFRPVSRRGMNRVRGRVRREYLQHQEETTSESSPRTVDEHEVDRLALAALHEVLFMSPRLIVAKPELYAEFSRVRGECVFRDAILLPLPVLGVAIATNLSVATSLKVAVIVSVLLVDGYLFAQARKLFRDAHSLIAHSLADGTISSAAMSDRD